MSFIPPYGFPPPSPQLREVPAMVKILLKSTKISQEFLIIPLVKLEMIIKAGRKEMNVACRKI